MHPSVFHLTFFLLLVVSANCANIFFFFTIATYSHRIAVWPLVEALADRGHNITFASNSPPKVPDPRIHEFCPAQFKAKLDADATSFGNFSIVRLRIAQGQFIGGQAVTRILPSLSYSVCEDFLSDPETQTFIQTSKFDLVVIDGVFNDCAFGMAAKWGAKTIIFGTTHPFPWLMETFGVMPETSVYSDILFSFQHPLSFLEKIFGTLDHLAWYYYRQFLYYPKLQVLLREKLNFPGMPELADLERQVGLVLYNSHFSEELARSLPPLFIPVGGIHIELSKDAKIMPMEITKFIDGSGEAGFILVSFGSEVRISDALELQTIFFTAFERSKTRIIFKWDGARPKELSANILTVGWFPQNEILASKNCKAFITHGGLLSAQEALTHGVPMIAIPVFAEQDYNAFRLERTGRGIRLDMGTLTLEILETAISKILSDKSYKENAQRVSKLFQDRPAKPVETAVWWTEYILRHDDTSHLKPLSIDQFWFQMRLLDVWAFLLALLIFLIYIFLILFRKIIRLLFNCPENAPKIHKAKSSLKELKKSQ